MVSPNYTDGVGVQEFPVQAMSAARPRAFVGVVGTDAESLLQRLLSNDVAALGPGESCDALLLTAKARVIAPLRVLRRAKDDFLLWTEPELGERLRGEILRMRFAAKAEVELEDHRSYVLLGPEARLPEGSTALPTAEYGVPGWEVLDERPDAPRDELDRDRLEAMRIRARTPRYGREIDDRVLPAEAGLVERAVSFTKGCYPGQEPIARLHYRGHANRGLRVLELESSELPAYDAEVDLDGKTVGRVTSAVREADGRIVALAYVRREVPKDADLRVGSAAARSLD